MSKEKLEIVISPSMIYGLWKCDGLVLANSLLPRTNNNDISYLKRGKLLHLGLELDGQKSVRANYTMSKIEKDEGLVEAVKVWKHRDYYPNLTPELKEKSFRIPNYFETNTITVAFELTVDAGVQKSNHLTIIDYKSSRERSVKDVEQMKGYISAMKTLHPDMNIDGVIDYLVIDNLVYVMMTNTEIVEFNIKVRGRIQEIIDAYVNFLETGSTKAIHFEVGDHCGLCPSKGRCRMHQEVVGAATTFLNEANVDFSEVPDVLSSEYEKVCDLIKQLGSRKDALSKAILRIAKDQDIKFDGVNIITKSSPRVIPEILHRSIERRIKETKGLSHRRVLNDVFEFTKLSITKESVTNMPEYLQLSVADATTMDLSESYVQKSRKGSKKKEPVVNPDVEKV